MWKIMIVEDQQIVRDGLKMMIEMDEQLIVVAVASDGEEAISILENTTVDVILMDIRMPRMDGLDATKMIKKRWPKAVILILTTFNDDEYAIQALKFGVNGFMLKTSDQKSLLEAIHSCLNGGLSIHDQVAAKMMPKLLHPVQNEENTSIHLLTPRELTITKLVGEGKTNKEISKELFLSIGTVKNHITQILHKLNLRDRTQLAIYAVKSDIS